MEVVMSVPDNQMVLKKSERNIIAHYQILKESK